MENLIINDASILFRNFRGEGTKYNQLGNRNFCVILDDDIAQNLINEGWNVRILRPRDEDDDSRYYMQVKVSYDYPQYAPKLYLVANNKKTLLDEDTVEQLDYADLKSIDLEIRPRHWTNDAGEEKIKAYIKTGYFVLDEDPFADKYRDEDDGDEDEMPFM